MPATDDELALIAEFQRTRSDRAANAILRRYRQWCYQQANTAVRRFGIDFDDALQATRIGLLEAAERFEPERGVGLLAFASFRIRSGIAHVRGDAVGGIYIVDLQRRMGHAIRQILADGGRVTDETIAAKMGVGVGTIERAMAHRRTTSMDEPLSEDDGGGGGTMHDVLAALAHLRPDHVVQDKLDTRALRSVLEDAITTLTPRNAQIMKMWLDADCELGAQTAIAAELGVTNQRVSLAVAQSLPKLREALRGDRRIADVIPNRELEAERRRDDAWFRSLLEARSSKSESAAQDPGA